MKVPLVYLITNPVVDLAGQLLSQSSSMHTHKAVCSGEARPLELIQLIKTTKGIWLGLLHILAWLYLLASPLCVIARFQGATAWKSEVIRKYPNHLLTEENGGSSLPSLYRQIL